MIEITLEDYKDRNHRSKLPPVRTPTLSFCEYGFRCFVKQKVDSAMQNFINRGSLFAGSLPPPIPLLTCYQRYNTQKK